MKGSTNPRTLLYTLATLVGCCAILAFVTLIPPLFRYVAYSTEIPVEVERIEIVELAENFYAPRATFTTALGRHEELLENLAENNPYLLEGKMREWTAKPVVGYAYGSQSSLQKCFPIKQSIYLLVLIGLALYFLFLAKAKV